MDWRLRESAQSLHQAGAIQSDVPQGTMTSNCFWINGNSLRFVIGGSCYVNEILAELIVDGNVVFLGIVVNP